jgi:hypothetical protein
LKMLAALQPPAIPDETFTAKYPDVVACLHWHKHTAATLLGGLQTDAKFHANGIRFDWLLRLVLSKANGRQKPTRYELSRALNVGLDRAGVARLEDPNEDLFCELIVSERGSFRIFTGQWESAGAYTQTLLDAFESLPDAKMKSTALRSAYALLRLSDEVAIRADVGRDTSPGGAAMAKIELPSPAELRELAERVRFTGAELAKLGINSEMLAPYILAPDQLPHVSDRPVGDTPQEFHPLLQTPAALVLISPANVSLAVRSILIHMALDGGMGDAFQIAILEQQEKWTEAGQFWPVLPLSLSPPDPFFMRTSIGEYEPGRYLQVIQVPSLFGDFPHSAFGSVHTPASDALKSIATQIDWFWDFTSKKDDVRATTTVLLLSGWGDVQQLSPPISDDKVPANWQFFAATFADLLVMGVVPDMTFDDVLRVLRQHDRLDADGFEFQKMSGTLNLLGFWKSTGGNLIPEHLPDIRPPMLIMLPTDALLAPRIECARRRDCRALPLPEGGATAVERMERSDDDVVQPIYVSAADVSAVRFSAAVVEDGRVRWLDFGTAPQESREWRYRCLRAALQWVEAVGQAVATSFPKAFPTEVRRVRVVMPSSTEIDRASVSQLFSTPIWTAPLR